MKDLIYAEQSNPKGITPRCLICGEGLGGNRISCSSCDTPTHPECREWAGGCPTYACKERNHEADKMLVDAAPEEQQAIYSSFLSRLWNNIARKPVAEISIADIFGQQETLPQKAIYSPFFGIHEQDGFYRIKGVPYRGSLCTYDVQKDYFAGGRLFYINDLIAASQEEHKKGGFVGASLEETMSILVALEDNKHHPKYHKLVAEVQESVRKKMKDSYWILCRDKVIYGPEGFDTIVLNAGLEDEQRVQFPVVGPDEYEYVKQTKNPKLYQILTGFPPQKVHTVLRQLTSYDPYLWRFTSKLAQRTEYGVGSGKGFGRFGIILDDDHDWRALGVRQVSREAAAQKIPE